MSRRAELEDVAMVGGRLARVIAINEQRCITFAFVGGKSCPTCGAEDRVDLNEDCLIWRETVRPVSTCGPITPEGER